MKNKPGKWERTHSLLHEAAVSLFLEKRSANVSMDEIADKADVARRTLFNHFPGKELLVLEVTSPILTDGLHYLEELNRWDRVSLDEVINLFFYLWKKHGQSLNLLYAIDFEDFQDLKDLHGKYLREYMKVFSRIADWPEGLSERKNQIAVLFFRIFVNILNSLKDMPDQEFRFNKALKGLLMGMNPAEQ
ncbi:TetR/AcrR family transcriptional regulator [Spirochaeta isovalerica]|uniref:AcrR family transcriptional regulator n=1 Tax=Spirochaeta isovalerica TaxID=150 RepID=A0A841R679_9SPIO|nr:TetR/AcrR family transcriptional regulator [Spirochaeta isovalerica]MBB6478891.1 AcrR family transcriptional regulator [Spirochaeta isovalerica]